ncbi:MAG: asparagine synthase (glutamine-hydrolyzing) [Planctomycetes bacterium]|nr:asparagine synthase (glutamine-hydrolyzing) [Planctomycetota bacterium]
MCGISGEFRLDRADPDRVRRMGAAMAKRGPDGDGFFLSPCSRVALSHRRLAIRDLGSPGAQPFLSEDGQVALVFNGAIVNDVELRSDLEKEGHVFRTRSDTEVLLRAYLAWGDGCVARLRGFFAFAVWDARRQRLLLARDRFGEKPLYYRWGEGEISFASDLRAFRDADGRHPPIDPLGVRSYLLYGYVAAPFSIRHGIRKVRPGHILICGGGAMFEKPYWRLPSDRIDVPQVEASRRVADLLEEAVRLRLRSDVPVSLLLSGGVDSSAVASHLGAESGRVSAVTVRFGVPAAAGSIAREVAGRFALGSWREVPMGPGDLEEEISLAVGAYDEPLASSAALSTLRLCREAACHGKVALGGEGGDELFLGYGHYASFSRWRAWRAWISRVGAGNLGAGGPSLRTLSRDPLRRYRSLLCPAFDEAEVDSLLGPDEDGEWETRDPFRLHDDPSLDPLRRAQRLDLLTLLPDALLSKADRASMAHGLEIRLPFLDHALAEFVLRLPTERIVPGGVPKGLLRRHLGGRVPPSVLKAPKEGFSLPFLEAIDPEVSRTLGTRLVEAAIPGLSLKGVPRIAAERGERARAQRWMLYVLARWHAAWR